MRFSPIAIALTFLSGCAGMGTYETVAPKFEGRPVQQMVDFFGAPVAVSGTNSLQLYEWQIGEYDSEPATIEGNVSSGGSVTGTIQGGGTKFLGCIIRATADSKGVVTTVSLESRTDHQGRVQDWYGCSKFITDPFATTTTVSRNTESVSPQETHNGKNILYNSYSLASGMTKVEVKNVMGAPVATLMVHDIDEWHYCMTVSTQDHFVAVYFKQETLIDQIQYQVSLRDTGGVTGHCSQFVRQGSYEVPVTVTERLVEK